MNKFSTLLVILLSAVCTAQAQFTEIKGVFKRSEPATVKLYKVAYGRMEEIASITPAANGAFGFSFQPDYKGYYVIGTGDPRKGMQDKIKVYAKGNDKINLVLNDSTYVLTGVNTKENQVLEQWYKLTYQLEHKSVYFFNTKSTYVDFFPALESVAAKSKSWMNGKATGNADFDQLMKKTMDYDLAYYAMTFLFTPRSVHPTKADYTSYLKNFSSDHFLQNEDLYKFPYGMGVLGNLVMFKNKDLVKFDFDKIVMSIPSDKLKGEYVLAGAARETSYAKYLEIADKYNKYFLTADQKTRAEKIAAGLATFKQGERAISFTYPDLSGNQVSLTDFKGKIVLVDVWATWCGPCKQEIPSLKALEKEFHGKDVVFLSVSVDEEKDKEKWQKFIADGQLGGVQLFASGWSQITQAYAIKGIPRFMLFDKNGNIIDVDAPRPSDPKLKELLNEWLNKAL
ncbi:TlpA family protein disulfide reductase [Solitalea longa]|uniref:TlpA family protein disulfide reductase n=1 Tax=Solitalea longa TaxID=2079460 RepID=A0A2S5A7S2_9SPHI|nr:TlpA disulfide reductase family protein [Solitalea longa]POY38595.1 TlpA family protein disulfide reductase [Solitalea longa]